MISDLKPYPVMKDSGVPWLGEVPEHWEVLPNRALFAEVKERNHPEEQMLSVTITKGVIPQQKLLADSSKKDSSNQDKSAYKVVRPGDIAYNKMRAWQGAIGVSDYQGIVSPAYVVQRPRDGVYPRYFHYLLRTPAFAKEAERWSYGITSDMWSLRPEHFKMIYGCLPPLPEQAAIVRYLDYMDRRIRKYIHAKQKLIKLLEEQKQAIIHHAVTRGLDPNVRLKPSGIDWLGDVPEHWEVRRLKYIVQNVNDQTAMRGEDEIYIDLEHIESWTGRLYLSEHKVTFDSQVKRFQPGDILFGKLRPYLAKVTRPLCWGVCVGELLVLRAVQSKLLPEFIEYKLRSSQIIDVVNSSTFGAKMPRADWDFIGNLAIAFPKDHEEQNHILSAIKDETGELDEMVKYTAREIDLLREYRTRLIADVVKGKLDVREVAAKLPEGAEEPEVLGEIDSDENGEEMMGEGGSASNMEEAEV